jgi:hypothetical protein
VYSVLRAPGQNESTPVRDQGSRDVVWRRSKVRRFLRTTGFRGSLPRESCSMSMQQGISGPALSRGLKPRIPPVQGPMSPAPVASLGCCKIPRLPKTRMHRHSAGRIENALQMSNLDVTMKRYCPENACSFHNCVPALPTIIPLNEPQIVYCRDELPSMSGQSENLPRSYRERPSSIWGGTKAKHVGLPLYGAYC